MTPDEAFARWVTLLDPSEGALSLDPHDPGNWTGGKVGVGALVGTQFGISAAAHPDVDIRHLTLEQANLIRRERYWDEVRGDELPPPLAIMLADAAYLSGPEDAIITLQRQLGFTGALVDGSFGPLTMRRLELVLARPSVFGLASGVHDVVTEYAAQRVLYEVALDNWTENRLGWTRRVMHNVALAVTLA